LIEPIGSVTHYYLDCSDAFGGTFVASVGQPQSADLGHERLKLGDDVAFGIPGSAVHLFDRETGKRI